MGGSNILGFPSARRSETATDSLWAFTSAASGSILTAKEEEDEWQQVAVQDAERIEMR